MSHIPYRTGLTSIRLLLDKVCKLIITYQDVIYHVLPPAQHIYVDNVLSSCQAFMANTDNPRP